MIAESGWSNAVRGGWDCIGCGRTLTTEDDQT